MDNLIPLDKPLAGQASRACAAAFADDPETLYLFPGEEKREKLRFSFEYFIRVSLVEKAEIFATSRECEGIAIWSHSEAKIPWWTAFSINPLLPLRCGWRYIRYEITFERLARRLKKQYAPKPHEYLALLAVDPVYQGQGFAGKLLRPMLKKLDERQLPCYLETQNIKNVNMYRHFGFELVHETKHPHSGLPIFIMVRKPAAPRTLSGPLKSGPGPGVIL